jgi:hypothetical protein
MGSDVSANREPELLDEEERWVWRKGAVTGQFCDAYIKDTNLEGGFVCTSLKVFCLVLSKFPRVKYLLLLQHLIFQAKFVMVPP